MVHRATRLTALPPAPAAAAGPEAPVLNQPYGLTRVLGLDGLRAIAVLAVLFYHSDASWMPGGFLGVDVFFVISGFLITSLLLTELQAAGGIQLRRFYLRRARRLLPALFALLAIVAVIVTVWLPEALPGARRDIPAALFGVSNWWYVVSSQSYFDSLGRPPLLQHTWSLAVEAQFYALWPLVVIAMHRLFRSRGVRWLAWLGATGSTALVAVLAVRSGAPVHDPSRIYLGSDTHAMGLLAGAALATFWRAELLRPRLSRGARWFVEGMGALALAVVVFGFVAVNEFSPFLYHGGFLVMALATTVLIASLAHPGARLGSALDTPILRWLGSRSYGLYLWHWPIFMLTRPELDLSITGPLNLGLRLAITIVVAELSYRFVELPVRRGAIARSLGRMRFGADSDRRRARRRLAIAGGGVGLGVVGLAVALATSSGTPGSSHVAQPRNSGPAPSFPLPSPSPTPSATPTPSTPVPSTHPTLSTQPVPPPAPSPSEVPVRDRQVFAIGDSVLLSATDALTKDFPHTAVDAVIGRQAAQVLEAALALKLNEADRSIALVHLGNNGIITEKQMRGILEALAPAERVVIVNAHVPRRWQDPNNELIARVVPQYPNAIVADWNGLARAHREYLVKDGVHLTGPGLHAYVALIVEAAGA